LNYLSKKKRENEKHIPNSDRLHWKTITTLP